MIRPLHCLALLALLAGCEAPNRVRAPLTSTRVAPDFETYRLHRVGLLPMAGEGVDAAHAEALQEAFLLELSRRVPFEVVVLREGDLAEITPSDPYRRGWYPPRAVLDISRRFNLDGMFVSTVTQAQTFPPQVLGLQVELVASETGLVVWSASAQLDASDTNLLAHLANYQRSRGGGPEQKGEAYQLTLLSPSRFARFAAYSVVQGL